MKLFMALDPLEKERLRRRMADRMTVFQETVNRLTCISAHHYDEPHYCELCQTQHTEEIVVVRNRSGKLLRTSPQCLKEMIRFRITDDVEDLAKWLEKLSLLRVESEKRKAENEKARAEERSRLEKKVIVRRRNGVQGVS